MNYPEPPKSRDGVGRTLTHQALIPGYLFCVNNAVASVDVNGLSVFGTPILGLDPRAILGGAICAYVVGKRDTGGTDAYRHCMSSCELQKCNAAAMGPINAAIATLGEGLIIEIMDEIIGRRGANPPTLQGHLADLVSDVKGILGGLSGDSCKDKCKCEQGKSNPI